MSAELELIDDAAVVTLRWTAKRNALAPDDALELAAALQDGSRSGAAALVLTGEGAFCSGGDLKAFSEIGSRSTPEEMSTVVYGKIHAVVRALRDSVIPTIAAVDGAAVGLGLDLALACDMRYVGSTGWMLQGWSRVGLIAAGAGGHFLARHNDQLPWKLMLDQERLDAARCAELGLAWDADGLARDAALHTAGRLAQLPEATRRAYVELHRMSTWPSDDYLTACARHQANLLASEEFRARSSAILAAG